MRSGLNGATIASLLKPDCIDIYTKNKTEIAQINVGEKYKISYMNHVGNVSIDYKREMVRMDAL